MLHYFCSGTTLLKENQTFDMGQDELQFPLDYDSVAMRNAHRLQMAKNFSWPDPSNSVVTQLNLDNIWV